MKKIVFTILTISISTLTLGQVKKDISNNTTSKMRDKIESIDTTAVNKEIHSNDYFENLYRSRVDSIRKVYFRLNDITNGDNPKLSDFEARDIAANKLTEIEQHFIIDYPNCIQSTDLLNLYKTTWGKKVTNELFSLMNKERQESDKGKSIALFIELNRNLKIGDMYVDFEQENVNGEKIKISDIRGKYTLIEFWASWCAPCRAATPYLIKEYEKYKNQGFQIIGVSLDENKERWINAIEKDKIPWENISDLKGKNNKAGLIYGVSDIPYNILIDENGVIIGKHIPVFFLDGQLKELFKE